MTANEIEQSCGGYAAFETAHKMLHLENVSQAEADDAINSATPEVKAYAARVFTHCVALKVSF